MKSPADTQPSDNFAAIKTEILRRAKAARACSEQYGRAYKAKALAELMQVVKDNFLWACLNDVLTPDIIEKYRADFAAHDIYLNVDASDGFILCKNATVEASGNATVRAYDNATVRAYDNATVEASGNATVRAYDNATVEASGNATVEAYGNAMVRAYGNATVEASDNAYCSSYFELDCKLSDNAIYRVRSTNTIYYANDGIKFVKQAPR